MNSRTQQALSTSQDLESTTQPSAEVGQGLRMVKDPGRERQPAPAIPRTLAVTGGKGGVGKTSVALNLAMVLARQGYRTLLLDGDVELANVNIMLGLYPGMTLEHVILGERSLREVLLPVRENLDLLPGASGVPGCLDLAPDLRRVFLNQLATLERQYDQVIIDTAAGLQNHCLHMIASAHLACVVITPDPTSLTDAFSLLKVLKRRGYKRSPSVVVNMARGASQAQSVYHRFSAAVSRYLQMETHYLGAIWRDETLAQSVTSQKPVASLPPSDPSCRQFWTLADMLSLRWSQGVPASNGFSRYWQRLIERKASQKAGKQGAESVPARSPEPSATGPSPAGSSETGWKQQLKDWLADPSVPEVDRYRRMTEALALVGEFLDEDMLEVLQTGLSAMDWQRLSPAARRSAAAHFRQLAELVNPGAGAEAGGNESRPMEPRYDEAVFGSQDALLDRLRSEPKEQSINSLLEAMREREDRVRSAAGMAGTPRRARTD